MQWTMQWPDSLGTPPLEEEFRWENGHLYRKRGVHKEVNVGRPIDVIQMYARKMANEDTPMWTNPEDFIPYDDMEDFVLTVRRAGEEGSFFKIPSSLTYQQALATALCTLPAGCSVLIRNEMPAPDWALKDPKEVHSGSQLTEAVASTKGGQQAGQAGPLNWWETGNWWKAGTWAGRSNTWLKEA